MRAELAAAHIRLAAMYAEIGSSKWVDEMRKLVDLVEPLVEHGTDVSQWTSLRDGLFFKRYRGGDMEDASDPHELLNICNRGIATWQKLVETHPDVPGFSNDLAGFHFIRGGVIVQILKTPSLFKSADDSLRQAIEIWGRLSRDGRDPKTVQWQLGVANDYASQLFIRQADYEAAYQYAKQAIRHLEAAAADYSAPHIEHNRLVAYSDLKHVALALNRREEAVEIARTMATIQPNHDMGYVYLAEAHELLKDFAKALVDYDKSIDLNANRAWVRTLRGICGFRLAAHLWQLNEKDKARVAYDEALKWMQANAPDDGQIIRFRDEARELMGIEATSRPASKQRGSARPSDGAGK